MKRTHLLDRPRRADVRPLLTLLANAGVVVQLDAAPAGLVLERRRAVPAQSRTPGALLEALLSQEHTRDVVLGDTAHRFGTHHRAVLLARY